MAARLVLPLLALTLAAPARAEEDPAAPSAPAAQAPTRPVRTLTLEQAWELAASSPDAASLEARLQEARTLKTRVKAGLQPIINANVYYNRNSDEAVLAFGPLITAYTDYQLYANGLMPQPLPDEGELGELKAFLEDEIVIQPIDAYGAQVSGVWGLLNPRTPFVARQAFQTVDAAEASIEWGRRQLLMGVSQLYYGLYALQESVGVAERQLESKKRHLATTEARFAAGQLSKTDVMRAQVEVVQAERSLRTLGQQVDNLGAEFGVVLGVSGQTIRAARPSSSARPLPTVDQAAVDEVLSRRPDVVAARAQAAAARAARGDSRAAFFPSIAVTGTWRWSNSGGFTGQNDSWVVGAAANIPIWDGGMKIADARAADARLAQAEEALRKLSLTVEKDLAVAVADVHQAQIGLDAASRELELARATHAQIEALFNAGQITALELRDADLLVFASELGFVSAQLTLDQAWLKLDQVLGVFGVMGS